MADPRWRQIAEDLRLKIESGALGRDGKPLPKELDLQDQYSASRNTVREAVKWLASRDLVVTRSGQGTFVKVKAPPLVTNLHEGAGLASEGKVYSDAVGASKREQVNSEPKVEVQRADGVRASELGLQVGAMVVSRHQERRVDDVPFSLQTTFYPMEFVTLGASRLIQAEDIEEGAVLYLEQTLGKKEAGRRDLITVRAPDANEVEYFNLPDDGRVAMFELIRTGFDQDGHPMRVTITTLPTDRNQFVMTSGEVPE